MANINVNISYNPSTNTWSQDLGDKIQVNDQGANPIRWGIALAPGATGSIKFSTTNAAPGIAFFTTSVFPAVWPGATPQGNSNNWNSSLTNALKVGDAAQTYEYKVNALYTPANGVETPVSWDPEVEENPPSSAAIKLG